MKIAITGKICSGKSTLANKLKDKLKLEKYSFADNVKKYAKEIFEMEYKDRKLIQDFAEKMKELDNNIWIKQLDKEIKDKTHIVIDDLRFENEYNYLKANNYYIIKLVIHKNQQIKRIEDLYKDKAHEHLARLEHISECNIDRLNADLTINTEDVDIKTILETIIHQQ
jgi:cytidylate kinase